MLGKIALEEHYAQGMPDQATAERLSINPTWAETARRLPDIHDMRLKDMDTYGIEMSILSLNAPALQSVLDVQQAINEARVYNDLLAESVAKRPDRFAGFAALPMQDPDAAAEELTRCVQDLGFKGALVNGFTQKEVVDSAIYYDLPEYRSFWSSVENLGVPFYLHPRTALPTRAHHYEGHPWLISSVWGFAAETSIHLLRMISSGLFDDCPNLQIVVGHLGEHIPYDMWRIDHRIEVTPNGYPAKKPVSAYMRENVHVTTSGNFSDAALACAMTVLGVDRIMFSVDYPMEVMADGAEWFDTTDLSDSVRQDIGRANANKLFNLGLDD